MVLARADSRSPSPFAPIRFGVAPVPTQSLREIGYQGGLAAEREALVHVLERVQWNRAEAARVLKVSYKTILSKISQLRLTPGTDKSPSPSSWPS